jgi:hypothetical protein
MPDYSKAKVYRLECNGLFYYGSTVNTLAQRMSIHRSTRTCSSRILFEMGNEVKIELVEEYACSCKRELEERENFWIINNPCVNIKSSFRTDDELKNYKDGWYQANKDRIKDKNISLKPTKSQYNKEYRLANLDKIKEQQEGYKERKAELQRIRRQTKKIKDIK